jgi:hypothetical protein
VRRLKKAHTAQNAIYMNELRLNIKQKAALKQY